MDRKLIRKRDREPVKNVDRAVLADEDLERVVGGEVFDNSYQCPECRGAITPFGSFHAEGCSYDRY